MPWLGAGPGRARPVAAGRPDCDGTRQRRAGTGRKRDLRVRSGLPSRRPGPADALLRLLRAPLPQREDESDQAAGVAYSMGTLEVLVPNGYVPQVYLLPPGFGFNGCEWWQSRRTTSAAPCQLSPVRRVWQAR